MTPAAYAYNPVQTKCTAKNGKEYQQVTGWYESANMPLSKRTGWPTFAQGDPSVKTVG